MWKNIGKGNKTKVLALANHMLIFCFFFSELSSLKQCTTPQNNNAHGSLVFRLLQACQVLSPEPSRVIAQIRYSSQVSTPLLKLSAIVALPYTYFWSSVPSSVLTSCRSTRKNKAFRRNQFLLPSQVPSTHTHNVLLFMEIHIELFCMCSELRTNSTSFPQETGRMRFEGHACFIWMFSSSSKDLLFPCWAVTPLPIFNKL